MAGLPLRSRLSASLLAASLAGWASAATTQSVSERIVLRNAIVLGFTAASPPMSYLGPDKKPIGYTIDLCRAVAQHLKARLGKPDLEVRFLRIELDTRTRLVSDGSIDLVCNGTSNTVERQKEFGFSPTVFVTETRLVTKAGSPVSSLDDLAGAQVVVSAGSTAQKTLQALAEKRGLTLSVARSNDAAFDQLLLGWAQAFALDDVVLDGLIATKRHPEKYRFLPDVLAREAIGIAFDPADRDFARLVWDAVVDMMQGGEVEKLYQKWFENPIPPFDHVIGRPMSKALESLLARPSNQPLVLPANEGGPETR